MTPTVADRVPSESISWDLTICSFQMMFIKYGKEATTNHDIDCEYISFIYIQMAPMLCNTFPTQHDMISDRPHGAACTVEGTGEGYRHWGNYVTGRFGP